MSRGVTALFGGSFDPVHLGHENAVRSLLDEIPDIGRVIIMPAYVNPFKAGEDFSLRATSEQRMEMCRIAFGKYPRCIVSDFEISRKELSYTIITLEYLREEYPDDRLILTVGSDSLKSLPRWHRFSDIIKTADIAAIARSDEDASGIEADASEIRRLGGRVRIIRTKPFEISSTEIRKKIFNSQDISCYTDKNVVEYIVNEKIYRLG